MIVPKLYRKRFIPNELIYLKDDEILRVTDEVVVTRWRTLKKRSDFTHGVSCYFLNEGFKISKFYNGDECIYIYCDIIETEIHRDTDEYIFKDLLIDVIVYENGFVKVVDVAEIADALDEGLITSGQAKYALRTLDRLLDIIYSKQFDGYIKFLHGEE